MNEPTQGTSKHPGSAGGAPPGGIRAETPGPQVSATPQQGGGGLEIGAKARQFVPTLGQNVAREIEVAAATKHEIPDFYRATLWTYTKNLAVHPVQLMLTSLGAITFFSPGALGWVGLVSAAGAAGLLMVRTFRNFPYDVIPLPGAAREASKRIELLARFSDLISQNQGQQASGEIREYMNSQFKQAQRTGLHAELVAFSRCKLFLAKAVATLAHGKCNAISIALENRERSPGIWPEKEGKKVARILRANLLGDFLLMEQAVDALTWPVDCDKDARRGLVDSLKIFFKRHDGPVVGWSEHHERALIKLYDLVDCNRWGGPQFSLAAMRYIDMCCRGKLDGLAATAQEYLSTADTKSDGQA